MAVVLNCRIHWEAIGVWRENGSKKRSLKNNKELVGLLLQQISGIWVVFNYTNVSCSKCTLKLSNVTVSNIYYLPMHFLPSPEYPGLQVQL